MRPHGAVFGTLQQRLPPLLRLNGISTIAAADRYLAETYLPSTTLPLPWLRPRKAAPLWRSRLACRTSHIKHERVAGVNNGVRYDGLMPVNHFTH